MKKIELIVDGQQMMKFTPDTRLEVIWGCLEATPINSEAEIYVDGKLQAFRYGVDCWRAGSGDDDFFAPLWAK